MAQDVSPSSGPAVVTDGVSPRSPTVAALWAASLFALPFHRVWSLPWLGTKLQPPEILFLGLAVAAIVLWWRGQVHWRPVWCDAAAAAWLVASLAALAGPGLRLRFTDAEAIAESVGGVYLVCLYATIRLTATPHLLDRFGTWFSRSAALAAALGIAGVVLVWLGVPTALTTAGATPVPYLQQAPRARAFTAGPQMLASILLVAVPIFIGSRMPRAWRRRDSAVLAVLLVGLAATVSKTALSVVAALAVMRALDPRHRVVSRGRAPGEARRDRRPVRVAVATSLLVALVFTTGSHVMLVREADVGRMRIGQIVAGEPLASFEWAGTSWRLMPTTYFYNKTASLLAIARSWPAGVGPAQQRGFTARLQREGRFPDSTWITDPHCTYLGPVAELGAPGLLALVLLLLTGGAAIRRLLRAPGVSGWEAAAYAGAATGFLIEAIATDLLNCRHYWWLFAVIAARLAQANPVPGVTDGRQWPAAETPC